MENLDVQPYLDRAQEELRAVEVNIREEILDLPANERLALTQLLDRLKRDHGHVILQVVLYGSIARHERGPDSDLDLLIITHNDDWREHEPIRFLAARLSNVYDTFLSVRVMSLSHFQELKSIQPLLYQNLYRDGLELLRIGDEPGLVEQRPLPVSAAH